MVESESSGTWGTPSDVAPPSGPDNFSELDGVTCTSAGSCVAVGQYQDASALIQAMVETEAAGTWAPQASEITAPTDASSTSPNSTLFSVSCTSLGNCLAVGTYENSSGDTRPMIAVETNGSWARASSLSMPPDAQADSTGGRLFSVSCTGPGDCVAVGDYYNTADGFTPLIETESDGSWDPPSTLDLPSNTGTGDDERGQLESVSCTGLGNCALSGFYYDSALDMQALSATESGGSWGQAVEFENFPLGADTSAPQAELNSLACASNSQCTAVGAYTDTGADTQAMAVSTAAPTPTAPTITSASSTSFTAGIAGSFTVAANGIPGGPTLTLSDGGASLPSGVTFVDNGNGTATLAGTPAAGTQGTYPFTITAANGVSPNATQSFNLTVAPAGSTPRATISTGAPSDVTATSATLNWTVQPDGDDLYFYTVYCDPVNGSLPSLRTTASTPAGAVPADNNPHALATPFTGLRPGTAYTCGLSMGDNTGHSFQSYPAVEDVTSLTAQFVAFSAAASAAGQLSWQVNPEGDSLASYSVACSSSAPAASAAGAIGAGVLPADEAPHTLTVSLSGLAPGASYSCVLSLTDADGLTVSDAAQTFSTSPVSVPTQTFSSGAFVAAGGACGGSTGTVCSGNGEDVGVEAIFAWTHARTASAGPVLYGRFKFRIKAHHHGTIRFKLTPAARKLLLKQDSLATTLVITVKVHGKNVTSRTPLTIVYAKPKTRRG
jgi:hypothetical protein